MPVWTQSAGSAVRKKRAAVGALGQLEFEFEAEVAELLLGPDVAPAVARQHAVFNHPTVGLAGPAGEVSAIEEFAPGWLGPVPGDLVR